VPTMALVAAALALVVGAQLVGREANAARKRWPKASEEPLAPTERSAPFLSLGYREAMADVVYVRAMAYFGGEGTTSAGLRRQIQAIAALDPQFEEPMSWGSLAMQSLTMAPTQDDYLAVAQILEAAMVRFPDNYRLPLRAGEIYALRLTSGDPAQVRRWKERGHALLARAVRLPEAPPNLGTFVAHLGTQLGQREQAIRDLRELILYTTDLKARDRLVKKLATLTEVDAASLAFELDREAARFKTAWDRDRPELPASMYVLAGPPIAPWFDPATLAGDDELPREVERLPGLADDVGERR
jgi:hypothetical protein